MKGADALALGVVDKLPFAGGGAMVEGSDDCESARRGVHQVDVAEVVLGGPRGSR